MEQLKFFKEQIMNQIASQMNNLENVNTKEMGEAIDMIKDLAEAIYYCTVVKAMEDVSEEKRSTNNYYYTDHYFPHSYYRDVDRDLGRMYYSTPEGNYTEHDYSMNMRDSREGRSPQMRKMYMESKDMHHEETKTMQELERYMQELTSDMLEMINKASPDEKALLQKKVNMLANKIQNV